MSEQNTLKKQLLTHMIYNLMAFALIFSVFGFIVASMFNFKHEPLFEANEQDKEVPQVQF